MSELDAHLLIVDDDERIRDLLKKFLMRHGFLVTAARDAAHARRVLSGLDFDLIVLDVMMPGEDGISLTKALRETSVTPILLLTAKGDTEHRIQGFEAGAVDGRGGEHARHVGKASGIVRRRIVRIGPGHRLQQERRVGDAARQRSGGIL